MELFTQKYCILSLEKIDAELTDFSLSNLLVSSPLHRFLFGAQFGIIRTRPVQTLRQAPLDRPTAKSTVAVEKIHLVVVLWIFFQDIFCSYPKPELDQLFALKGLTINSNGYNSMKPNGQ